MKNVSFFPLTAVGRANCVCLTGNGGLNNGLILGIAYRVLDRLHWHFPSNPSQITGSRSECHRRRVAGVPGFEGGAKRRPPQ